MYMYTHYRLRELISCPPLSPGALARGMMTPSTGQLGSMTPEQMQSWRWEKEMDDRNRPLSDDELDALFPQDGYKVGGGIL